MRGLTLKRTLRIAVLLYNSLFLRNSTCNAHVHGARPGQKQRALCYRVVDLFCLYGSVSLGITLHLATRIGQILLRSLPRLLIHRRIPPNIVSLFRVFTLVVVPPSSPFPPPPPPTALPLLGAIGEFNLTTETCTVCSERLDQFCFLKQHWKLPSEFIGSSFRCSRKEKRWPF